LVFLSTHSSHDNVGLLRFCLFVEDSHPTPSSFFIGDVLKVELSVAAGETDVDIPVGSGPLGSMVSVVHTLGGGTVQAFDKARTTVDNVVIDGG
jgi:hypothetical protein